MQCCVLPVPLLLSTTSLRSCCLAVLDFQSFSRLEPVLRRQTFETYGQVLLQEGRSAVGVKVLKSK